MSLKCLKQRKGLIRYAFWEGHSSYRVKNGLKKIRLEVGAPEGGDCGIQEMMEE